MQAAAMHTGVPKILSVNLFGDRAARARSMLKLTTRELDWWALEQAKKQPTPMNARQYFNAQSADSLIVAASITPTTVKTGILSPAQANQCFPLPFGVNSGPFAGQVFRFTCGGIWTTPGSGTLTIDAFHGPGTAQSTFAGGTDMGASPLQTIPIAATNIPWRLEGELVYRLISNVATSSTAWLTGVWVTQGTLATAGTGCVIPFGSTAAVSVDTTGTGTLGTYGALNFTVTFSASGATFVTEWTSMQSLN